MAKDADKALDVIGKKLKTKDQIDLDFSGFDYKKNPLVFEDITSNQAGEKKSPTDEECFSLKYALSSDYFGFNVISNLNLGRAFKLVYNEDGDDYDYNISPDAKRAKFPETEKFKMNEKWLRFVLNKVSSAKNSVLLLDDIFSQVTTGNYEIILPYKEQFAYICTILDEYPEAINKTLAFVRGPIANKIIADGGPDLMTKLAEKYNSLDKLVDGEGQLEISIKNKNVENPKVSIRSFNPKTNARTTLFKLMEKFAKENPGYDIYYNTSARINGCFDGVTMIEKNGKLVEKPCTFIFFGPMSEYDYYNSQRPAIGPYTLNRSWYKVGFEPVRRNGKIENVVTARWEDYTFPHRDKEDTSNYVSTVASDNITEVFNTVANEFFDVLNKTIDQGAVKSKQQINKTLQKQKTLADKERDKLEKQQKILEEKKAKEKEDKERIKAEKQKIKTKKSIKASDIEQIEEEKKAKTVQLPLIKEGEEQCK